jgi:hypothetical protein
MRANGALQELPELTRSVHIPEAKTTLAQLESIADRLAKGASSELTQLKAIEVSAKVKGMSGTREGLGPGAPLNHEEKAFRFKLLQEAMSE